MADFNPWLTRSDGNKGDARTIEAAGQRENIRWQTRWAKLSSAEDQLADALQAIFGEGICDVPGIVGALNARGIAAPENAKAWTEPSFVAEMKRLAYQPLA